LRRWFALACGHGGKMTTNEELKEALRDLIDALGDIFATKNWSIDNHHAIDELRYRGEVVLQDAIDNARRLIGEE